VGKCVLVSDQLERSATRRDQHQGRAEDHQGGEEFAHRRSSLPDAAEEKQVWA
jgi:hypothetical protein